MSKKKIGLLVTLTVLAMVSLVGYQVYSMFRSSYTISAETTRILEPVGADGRIDYLEAIRQLRSEGVTPENNSVVLLRQAFGTAELSDDIIDEYFEQLGIDVPPLDGNYIISLHDFVKTLPNAERPNTEELDEQFEAVMSRPWTEDEFPVVAMWIQSAEEPLQVVREASLRAKYCPPLISEDGRLLSVLLPDAQYSRQAVRHLCARAMLHLGNGDTDAAFEDSMTIHRLARLVGSGHWSIETLVGFALEADGCIVDAQIAIHGDLTADDARKYAGELHELQQVSDVVAAMDTGERYMLLDILCNVDEMEGVPGASFAGFAYDADLAMRLANELMDEVVAAGRVPDRSMRNQALEKFDLRIREISTTARNFGPGNFFGVGDSIREVTAKVMATMMFPAFSQPIFAGDRCQARQDVTQAALALAGWKAEHGAYPESLLLLVPEFLDSVPRDIFSENPLVYRRTDTGFLLYSVGNNETDDGGLSHNDSRGTDVDDIVIRTPDEDERIRAERDAE